jgi:hypothetical protein
MVRGIEPLQWGHFRSKAAWGGVTSAMDRMFRGTLKKSSSTLRVCAMKLALVLVLGLFPLALTEEPAR